MTFPFLHKSMVRPSEEVMQLGLSRSFVHQIHTKFMFPPIQHCPSCEPQKLRPFTFKKDLTLDGYLYMVKGVVPIKSVSFYCNVKGCFTYFQPLYYSRNAFGYFYTPKEGWDLEVFQVHTHYFMERNLADYFWFDQILAHVSTFNLVNKYNHAHVEKKNINPYLSGTPKS
ncbi:hypothetical protein CROQUDRAFT_148593 [Cronartium quercuum f. sp. fusiforme G11]|uniref:CxC5 like cysteine cluster associated with KDZ domain-containing protein n=1 Tax=Cronartium quercuum f. sp. fusiforme G11 TaxID=708437 RepID=A0A9P6NV62_9BASI|nr:hypothetical protein CROQUDRAFT_148593 [Cronartium quercuum f. sp. fusiforme G11]